jgi:dTDP-4-dehydrorhamnose reductase
MARYLIVGAGGMLGQDLLLALEGRDVTALAHSQLDIADATAVDAAVAGHDVVINAAGYTRVDDAESHEDEAFATNATGAENLARAAAGSGARLIHFSTDYVFDGRASTPYGEDQPFDPQNAYGRSKADGERRVLGADPAATILRTAWLYGAHGSNFAATMLRLAGDRQTVDVIDDQRGQPTWTRDVAGRVVEMLDAQTPSGIYHATNSGETTWYGFAREVFRLAGLDEARVHPTDSASFVRPAARPAYSVLGQLGWASVGLAPLRDWRAALAAAFDAGTFEAA